MKKITLTIATIALAVSSMSSGKTIKGGGDIGGYKIKKIGGGDIGFQTSINSGGENS